MRDNMESLIVLQAEGLYAAWVAAIGSVIAAFLAAGGVVTAALIAQQSVKSYREQKQIDNQNYRQQKETDRREEIAKRQREAYEHYFQAWWDVNRYAGTELHSEALSLYQTARARLFFYASGERLKRVSNFHRYIVDHPIGKDQGEVEGLFASMLFAVRKDFVRTELSLEDIKSRLTIKV